MKTITVTKPTTKLSEKVLQDYINSLTTNDGLREFRKLVNGMVTSHKSYKKAPKRAQHLQNQDKDINAILNELFGANASIKKTKALIKSGVIDPKNWVKDGEFVQDQYDWAISSFKKLKGFMPSDIITNDKFSPKQVVKALAKAASCSKENFGKIKNLTNKK